MPSCTKESTLALYGYCGRYTGELYIEFFEDFLQRGESECSEVLIILLSFDVELMASHFYIVMSHCIAFH